jgi:hypothetical protein
MSAPCPFAPHNGISPSAFLLLAGILRVGFGCFLERSGFGGGYLD